MKVHNIVLLRLVHEPRITRYETQSSLQFKISLIVTNAISVGSDNKIDEFFTYSEVETYKIIIDNLRAILYREKSNGRTFGNLNRTYSSCLRNKTIKM